MLTLFSNFNNSGFRLFAHTRLLCVSAKCQNDLLLKSDNISKSQNCLFYYWKIIWNYLKNILKVIKNQKLWKTQIWKFSEPIATLDTKLRFSRGMDNPLGSESRSSRGTFIIDIWYFEEKNSKSAGTTPQNQC